MDIGAKTVTLRLLGHPRLESDGFPARLDTRKAIALAAYLALARRPVGRDELAALLWPESDQRRARSALRRTLSVLQTACGGARIASLGDSLRLDEDAISVDVHCFRALAREQSREALEQAAALHQGDFLAGFALRDSAEFDDWQAAAADELRRELASVLERLTGLCPASDEAVAHARRRVALDPLSESAHCALMRLHARRGDLAGALRQYRECVAILQRELGVEPLEETTAFYESLRENGRPVAAGPPSTHTQGHGQLPLVGRDAELSRVLATYASIERDGRLIVIEGEPGIGKTRLASEALSRWARNGAVILQARCHSGEQRLAFGAVVELLRDARTKPGIGRLGTPVLAEAARLLPELASGAATPPVSLDVPAARRRLFDALADVITAACAGDAPGVVFVDDAQWADESSMDVLSFLISRLGGRPLALVLTRRGGSGPSADSLGRSLAEARRAGHAEAVALGRLSPGDVEALVNLAAPAQCPAAWVLYQESAGVPFFLVEYLAAAASGMSGSELPEGVRDLLAARVGLLGSAARQVLTAAAVIERPFDSDLIRQASGRSPSELADALDELTESGVLEASGPAYSVTHPKLREYAYASATDARRRLVHARVASSLARSSRRRPELAALAAGHYERAGQTELAARMYEIAADHARGIFANAEALGHYRSALALGHPDAARLHEAIGDLLTLQGLYRDALSSYETAAALGGPGDVERKLGDVHHRLGDWDAADAYYTDALSSPGVSRSRVLAGRSLNAHRAGRAREAGRLARLALDAAGDERSLAHAHNVAGICATAAGDVEDAREHLEASLDLARRLADPAALAAALNNLAHAIRPHDLPRAIELCEQALAECARVGDRHRQAALHSNLADLYHAAGRTREAASQVRTSATLLSEVASPGELRPEIWKLVEW